MRRYLRIDRILSSWLLKHIAHIPFIPNPFRFELPTPLSRPYHALAPKGTRGTATERVAASLLVSQASMGPAIGRR